jgi:DNA-binding transcriptional ArsR family regulator
MVVRSAAAARTARSAGPAAATDRIFHALADATRRDIVTRVLHRTHNVSTLARCYDMSFAAVQKHVAVLERAALVRKERRGREQIVRGNLATIRRARRLLDRFEAIWLARIDQLDHLLKTDQGDA